MIDVKNTKGSEQQRHIEALKDEQSQLLSQFEHEKQCLFGRKDDKGDQETRLNRVAKLKRDATNELQVWD